jgi:hypothetical protein
MIDTQTAAEVELNRLARGDECPALESQEQTDLLIKFKRGSIWVVGTAFQIGQRVIPTAANRNGHRYMVLKYIASATDQKTAATEPNWSITRDAQITDGNIIWQEDGWDWDGTLWDFNGAAEEAWRIKAMKTVGRSDFSMPQGISVQASQLHDHCLAMARTFHRSSCL